MASDVINRTESDISETLIGRSCLVGWFFFELYLNVKSDLEPPTAKPDAPVGLSWKGHSVKISVLTGI